MSIWRVLPYMRVKAQMREWRALGYDQVQSIKGLHIDGLGFICSGGYEPCEKYTLIPVQNLYQTD